MPWREIKMMDWLSEFGQNKNGPLSKAKLLLGIEILVVVVILVLQYLLLRLFLD